ncbi:hypothetical protein K438DRAFT_1797128 [Mycena galopus ATCC 62051]|nr:hypothetical protein K438DRAFT_1797128 [Mycena galopus ATCC 62051]
MVFLLGFYFRLLQSLVIRYRAKSGAPLLLSSLLPHRQPTLSFSTYSTRSMLRAESQGGAHNSTVIRVFESHPDMGNPSHS